MNHALELFLFFLIFLLKAARFTKLNSNIYTLLSFSALESIQITTSPLRFWIFASAFPHMQFVFWSVLCHGSQLCSLVKSFERYPSSLSSYISPSFCSCFLMYCQGMSRTSVHLCALWMSAAWVKHLYFPRAGWLTLLLCFCLHVFLVSSWSPVRG